MASRVGWRAAALTRLDLDELTFGLARPFVALGEDDGTDQTITAERTRSGGTLGTVSLQVFSTASIRSSECSHDLVTFASSDQVERNARHHHPRESGRELRTTVHDLHRKCKLRASRRPVRRSRQANRSRT